MTSALPGGCRKEVRGFGEAVPPGEWLLKGQSVRVVDEAGSRDTHWRERWPRNGTSSQGSGWPGNWSRPGLEKPCVPLGHQGFILQQLSKDPRPRRGATVET